MLMLVYFYFTYHFESRTFRVFPNLSSRPQYTIDHCFPIHKKHSKFYFKFQQDLSAHVNASNPQTFMTVSSSSCCFFLMKVKVVLVKNMNQTRTTLIGHSSKWIPLHHEQALTHLLSHVTVMPGRSAVRCGSFVRNHYFEYRPVTHSLTYRVILFPWLMKHNMMTYWPMEVVVVWWK